MAYNRDLQEDKEPLFDSIDTVEKILEVYPPMIKSLKCNEEKMTRSASEPELMATDLAELLVLKGIPFRKAYESVGKLVHLAEKSKQPINKLPLNEVRKLVPWISSDFYKIFDPAASVSKRNIIGGTAPAQVKAQLKFWRKKLQ
jgi:argininosuccinate lyase